MKFRLANLEATQRFGRALGETVTNRALIALSGEMGTGKTTFVQAVAAGLQIDEMVNSPTFLMMNEYQSGRLPLFHIDLYRFSENVKRDPNHEDVLNPPEHATILYLIDELEEIMSTPSLVIIEWAEVLLKLSEAGKKFFQQSDLLWLQFSYVDEDESLRSISFETFGPKSKNLLNNIFKSSKDMLIYL